MEDLDVFQCSKCAVHENNTTSKTQNISEQNQETKSFCSLRLSHSKQISSTHFQCFNYNFGFFILILGLIFATSSAQSQPLSDNEIATDLSHDTIDLPVSNNTAASAVHSPISQALPRVEAVSSRGKNHKKCPKTFRKTFCFHGGRCHWIEEIQKPTCRCKRNWEGQRCEVPRIDFTSDNNDDNVIIAVAFVVSFVVIAALIAIFCICWRRMKSVRRDLELEQIEKQDKLINENDSSQSTNIVLNT